MSLPINMRELTEGKGADFPLMISGLHSLQGHEFNNITVW